MIHDTVHLQLRNYSLTTLRSDKLHRIDGDRWTQMYRRVIDCTYSQVKRGIWQWKAKHIKDGKVVAMSEGIELNRAAAVQKAHEWGDVRLDW